MHTNKIFFLILTSMMLVACSNQKRKSIKIMTWNIWHGGIHGSKDIEFKKDTVNTINIYKILKQESPDVLLMQETYCCGMEIAQQADINIRLGQVLIYPFTVNFLLLTH